MADYFTRHADTPVDPAHVRGLDTHKPFVVVTDPCRRCGGAGGFKGWPGFTCYRCGGAKWEQPREERVYTREQLDKLNATRDKRRAATQATRDAERHAARTLFETTHAELLASIPATWLDDDNHAERAYSGAGIVYDIVTKGRRFGSISEKQAQTIRDIVAKHLQRQAARAHQAATSQFVGAVSERLSVEVTCTKHATYERENRYLYSQHTETVHVCQFTDAAGNVLVTKTPTLVVEPGVRGVLTGRVKQHDVYQDVRQTRLERATFQPA